MKSVIRTAALTLAASLCAPLAAPAQDDAAVASAVEAAMKAAHAPGASVAVMERGKVVFEQGFGVKDVALQAPVDAHTRFEIGSITKQFTAAAILQLKDAGKLSLTDPLGKYVPQYAAAKNVTIEQLLWQVSGIPNYTEANGFVRYSTKHPASLDAILSLIKDKPPAFAPGTRWEYSNTNYYLLGQVVEAASGMPWEQYVRTHIFVPAQMTESTFTDRESGLPDMAVGYQFKSGNVAPAPMVGSWPGGAGAIVSTAGDLLKWDSALLAGKIVPLADVQLMMQPGRLTTGKSTGYGFGWFIDTHDGTPRIAHSGGTFGFSAENELYPKLGEAIVVLQNSTGAPAALLAGSVFAAVNPQLAQSESKSAANEDPAITARAKATWQMLSSGTVDRSQLDAQMNKAMTDQLLAAAAQQFKALGAAQSWVYRGKTATPGDTTTYQYLVTFAAGIKLNITMTLDKDGKIAGYFARPM